MTATNARIETRAEALAGLRDAHDRMRALPPAQFISPHDQIVRGPAWDAFVKRMGEPSRTMPANRLAARLAKVIAELEASVRADRPATDGAGASESANGENMASAAEIARLAETVRAGHEPVHRQSLRRLTPDGTRYARELLARFRDAPDEPIVVPDDLLYGERYARTFGRPIVTVEWRRFTTRREAAEYLAPLLAPVRREMVGHAGAWSWLGMFYLPGIVATGGALSPEDETIVVDRDVSRSMQNRYRHYLWAAWASHERYGDTAGLILDQRLTALPRLTRYILGSVPVFNSAGVVPLMLRLYTRDGVQRQRFTSGPGNPEHLLRTLRQLELTHDVYAMDPDALLAILPPAFRELDAS